MKTRPSGFIVLLMAVGVAGACGTALDEVAETTDLPTTTASTPPAAVATIRPTAPSTTTTTSPLDPRVREAADVAERFMKAFTTRDMEGIEATAVEGHVFGLFVDQFALFENEFSWLEAVGWKMTFRSCEIANPEIENLRFTCSVEHETSWSRALGVGPYDSEFPLAVSYPGTDSWIYPDRDSPTVTTRAFIQFPAFYFKSETWTPFQAWLEDTYPEDVAAMFTSLAFTETGLLPGEPIPALTEESVAAWAEHSKGFVDAVSAGG